MLLFLWTSVCHQLLIWFFLFCRAFWKFNFLYSIFFLPPSLFLWSFDQFDERAIKRPLKKVKSALYGNVRRKARGKQRLQTKPSSAANLRLRVARIFPYDMSVCMSSHEAENHAKLRSPSTVQTPWFCLLYPFPARLLQLSFSRYINRHTTLNYEGLLCNAFCFIN